MRSAFWAMSRFICSRSTLKKTIPASSRNTRAIQPRPVSSASSTPFVRARAVRLKGALKMRTGSGSATEAAPCAPTRVA